MPDPKGLCKCLLLCMVQGMTMRRKAESRCIFLSVLRVLLGQSGCGGLSSVSYSVFALCRLAHVPLPLTGSRQNPGGLYVLLSSLCRRGSPGAEQGRGCPVLHRGGVRAGFSQTPAPQAVCMEFSEPSRTHVWSLLDRTARWSSRCR